MKPLYKKILAAGIVCGIGVAQTVFAAGLLPDCANGNYSVEDIFVLIFNIIKFIWGITGTLALFMFVWGGFLLLFAAGDPQKVKGGVNTLKNALIGILIVLGSWMLINLFVNVLTGSDIGGTSALFQSAVTASGCGS